jgi:positive regulator of sigma E activity
VIRTTFFDKRPKDEALANGGEEKVDIYIGQKQVLESRQAIYLFMIVPLAITAIFSILLCLFPNTLRIYDLAQTAVNNIFGGM